MASGTRRVSAGALLLCAAFAVALPGGSWAGIVGATFTPDGAGGGELKIEGAPLNTNNISVREKTNPKTGEKFLEISDPQGILATGVPPGCSLVDDGNPSTFATEMRCPIQGITKITVLGGIKEDTVLVDLETPIETRIDLGGGDDTASGGPASDTQNGGPGDDEMFGGPGNDNQNGGLGDDVMSGQTGNDRQRGLGGRDRLSGGKGSDTGQGGGGDDKCSSIEKGADRECLEGFGD